jgi:nonsense-mediated mRNA decay protein 3
MAIAESVPRHNEVVHCPACSSYLRPPRSWIRAAPDSAELMQILIRRVDRHTARHGVAIAAAEFVAVPTEPPHYNSKRLALRVRLRRETTHGVTVKEDHVSEFAVHDRLCDACGMARARAAGPDQQWSAVVQVRQRASHRRTLIHLDQQIVRHGAADSAVRVDGSSGGLDFYFASRSHAARLVEFVSSVAPARVVGVARQLVSPNSFRDVFSVELCAICRDDLIFLPREASRAIGGLGPLVLCVKVSKSVSLLDTNSMRLVAMSIAEYDRYRFEPLLSSRRLVEYVVLDVFVPYPTAWVQIARASDLGKNDTIFTVKTHIGWRLNPGDHVLARVRPLQRQLL